MVEFVAFSKPEIRGEYERRLGAYLVKFNELEIVLGWLLAATFKAAGVTVEKIADRNMAVKIDFLSVLQLAPMASVFAHIDVARLRAINKQRNDYAHGHFSQNILDGSFRIIGAKKGEKGAKGQYRHGDTPEAQIKRAYEELDRAMGMLLAAEWELSQAFVWSEFAERGEPDE